MSEVTKEVILKTWDSLSVQGNMRRIQFLPISNHDYIEIQRV